MPACQGKPCWLPYICSGTAVGTMSLVSDSFVAPNGLAFSPDERVLYITDSRRHHIRAFDVLPNGLLAKQTDRVFADLRGSEPGVSDGMKVDVEGNVYCGGAGGLWILVHHPDPPGRRQREDSRHGGADPETIGVVLDALGLGGTCVPAASAAVTRGPWCPGAWSITSTPRGCWTAG
jgi:hypothetical protein